MNLIELQNYLIGQLKQQQEHTGNEGEQAAEPQADTKQPAKPVSSPREFIDNIRDAIYQRTSSN